MSDKELLNLAINAKNNSYSPYSHFRVGCALLCNNGQVFCGCNIENSAYSPTCCAERVAIFKAISEGETSFSKIAINSDDNKMTYPCGVCRQVISEFAPNLEIIVSNKNGEFLKTTLNALLPNMFNLQN